MSKKVTVELTGPARILVGRKEGRHTINDLDGKAMFKEGDHARPSPWPKFFRRETFAILS